MRSTRHCIAFLVASFYLRSRARIHKCSARPSEKQGSVPGIRLGTAPSTFAMRAPRYTESVRHCAYRCQGL
jgi:hypothetical protein